MYLHNTQWGQTIFEVAIKCLYCFFQKQTSNLIIFFKKFAVCYHLLITVFCLRIKIETQMLQYYILFIKKKKSKKKTPITFRVQSFKIKGLVCLISALSMYKNVVLTDLKKNDAKTLSFLCKLRTN